ncbi:MAG TPA: transposase [Candidatus Acidoferrum sp.]|nr:transposase [Candidatus Acidoferrum sp.]
MESSQGKKFLRFDRQLDTERFGPTWLRQPEMARIVSAAIGEVSHKGLCAVHAYVVMPNHVHLLLEPKVELKEITKAIKGCSARECNKALNRMGQRFWQDESFDHWVRSATSFERIRKYIESNPVSAGLVKEAKDWQWSSAFK